MVYAQPSYQAGVVSASLAHRLPDGKNSATAMREVPDVAALAATIEPRWGYVGRLPDVRRHRGGRATGCRLSSGFANPAIYKRYRTTAFHDVTDDPFGRGHLAEVRDNYVRASKGKGPTVTYLRTLGIDGEGAASLHASRGYDDATGVGSPNQYVQSFQP